MKTSSRYATYCFAVAMSNRSDFSVKIAQRIINKIPATNPASRIAKGIPTIPDPTMALTKLAVHPKIVLFFSWTASCFCRTCRRVPPGVCWTTTILGVDGLKNGLDGAVRGVDDMVGCYNSSVVARVCVFGVLLTKIGFGCCLLTRSIHGRWFALLSPQVVCGTPQGTATRYGSYYCRNP